MATKKGRAHGQEFTVLVGNFPYGSDPSHNLPAFQAPPPSRQGVTYQVVGFGDGGAHAQNANARIGGTAGPKTASFTVDDNDFSTGPAVLTLGPFEVISNVDYVVGSSDAVTATNIAAAISNLAGFSATANLAVVSVEYDIGPADIVDFSVVHHGTIENLTPLTPATGTMANGGPGIVAPALV